MKYSTLKSTNFNRKYIVFLKKTIYFEKDLKRKVYIYLYEKKFLTQEYKSMKNNRNYSIMNMNLDEEINKTNKEFKKTLKGIRQDVKQIKKDQKQKLEKLRAAHKEKVQQLRNEILVSKYQNRELKNN